MGSLYIHIPFCERKCVYCDFYSVESRTHTTEFLDALIAEVELAAVLHPGEEMDTLFFGGGTPSLLDPSQLEGILEKVHRHFRISPDAEITVETNPGTVTPDKLRGYRALGVNRLSIGIQSFHEDELRFLGRIHDGAQAVACVDDARAVGFDNISVDLIYSLPGQTAGRWEENLHHAAALSPVHISAYSLIVEDGTPLARMVAAGASVTNSVDEEASLYSKTMDFLMEQGYEHYEVSNYAKPGYRSRHNSSYWTHANYIGLGPSAHSFQKSGPKGRRWANVPNISTYIERLRKRQMPVNFEETVLEKQMVNERIFLGLRSTGLNLGGLQHDYGVDLGRLRAPIVEGLLSEKLALMDGCMLRLTPRGFLLCDEIAGRMMI